MGLSSSRHSRYASEVSLRSMAYLARSRTHRTRAIRSPRVLAPGSPQYSLVDVPHLKALWNSGPLQNGWMGAGPVPRRYPTLRGFAIRTFGILPSLVPFSRLLFHATILLWESTRRHVVEVDSERAVRKAQRDGFLAEGRRTLSSMAIETLSRDGFRLSAGPGSACHR